MVNYADNVINGPNTSFAGTVYCFGVGNHTNQVHINYNTGNINIRTLYTLSGSWSEWNKL